MLLRLFKRTLIRLSDNTVGFTFLIEDILNVVDICNLYKMNWD